MASVSEPVTFREFCPLYYLLNAIPTKIQRGFRSIVVYLTALDTNGDYIAVGSSIGMLYLYCRHLNQMKKYNFEVSLLFFVSEDVPAVAAISTARVLTVQHGILYPCLARLQHRNSLKQYMTIISS